MAIVSEAREGLDEALGVYCSVPFCRGKCTFCNFSSDSFHPARMPLYIARLCTEIAQAHADAGELGATLPRRVDTLFFGGGTPTLLAPEEIDRIFAALRSQFAIEPDAEITVEAAPGQLPDRTLATLLGYGVNRLSFGVQSFDDREARAVGRTHTAASCRAELRRVAAAGIGRLALDLIVGLPHQTEASWRATVAQAIDTGVEHISIYMLELDDDSRLGREVLGAGAQFGAATLPDEEAVADWYLSACEQLERGGLAQYEISNFSSEGAKSRHNHKYWTGQPYIGFGLDAHTMLRAPAAAGRSVALRWANEDVLESYMGPELVGFAPATPPPPRFRRTVDRITSEAALEERLFLGLRLVDGVAVRELRERFGAGPVDERLAEVPEIVEAGLLSFDGERLRLTARGRLASNEVFGRLLATPV